MKSRRVSCRQFAFLLVATAALAFGSHVRADDDEGVPDDLSLEQIALMTKRTAVENLEKIISENKRPANIAVLMVRLAEERQQIATLQRQIDQARAQRDHKTYDEKKYLSELQSTLQTLNQVISKYPLSAETGRAYYLRGKVHREFGHTREALSDFKRYVDQYPSSSEVPVVFFAIGDLYFDLKDYSTSAKYLSRIKLTPKFKYYPQVLSELAWDHYYLGQFKPALGYLTQEANYYKKKLANDRRYAGEFERSCIDYSQFYVKAIELKIPGHTLESAYRDFKSFTTSETFGSTALNFSRLMRVKLWHEKVEQWKDIITDKERGHVHSVQILLATLEHQIYHQRVNEMKESMIQVVDQIHLLPESDRPKAHDQLLRVLNESAATFTVYVQKNRGHAEEDKYRKTLSFIYETLLGYIDSHDPKRAAILYNLADNYYFSRDYERSAQTFKKVSESRGATDEMRKGAKMRAVAARFESLRSQKYFPDKIKISAIDQSNDSVQLEPKVAEWISWVDELIENTAEPPIDGYAFEANRLLYSRGAVSRALDRLTEFSRKYPQSKFAPPSQTLVIDTYVASRKWNDVNRLTGEFKRSASSGASTGVQPSASAAGDLHQVLAKKLDEVRIDSSYKALEEKFDEKDYASVLSGVESFVAENPRHPRTYDALALAASSAASTGDRKRAVRYYDEILKGQPNGRYTGDAWLAKGAEAESRFEYLEAALAYRRYFELPASSRHLAGDDSKTLKQKTILYGWVGGNPAEFRNVLLNSEICANTKDNETECDRGRALLRLQDPALAQDGQTARYAYQRYQKGVPENRWIWGLVALHSGKTALTLKERTELSLWLSKNFSNQEALLKLASIPVLHRSIPEILHENRQDIDRVYALNAKRLETVKARAAAVAEYEKQVVAFADLPWVAIQASALTHASEVYGDWVARLSRLQFPGGTPEDAANFKATIENFEKTLTSKRNQYVAEAFEAVSKSGADDSVIASLVIPGPRHPVGLGFRNISLDLMNGVSTSNEENEFQKQFRSALAQKNIVKAAFMNQWYASSSIKQDSHAALYRGLALHWAGAVGEALTELDASRMAFANPWDVNLVLLSQFVRVYNKERTRAMLADVVPALLERGGNKGVPSQEALFVMYAAKWSEFELTSDQRSKLSQSIRKNPALMATEPARFVFSPGAQNGRLPSSSTGGGNR